MAVRVGLVRTESIAGAALVALFVPLRTLLAQDGAPPSGHRVQCVRADDGTPIGGAEVYDYSFGAEGRITGRLLRDPDREMPKVACRLVADGDGYVELGPDQWHQLLARAPGRYCFRSFVDFERAPFEKLELFDDEPLVIELVDERGAPVEGMTVEREEMQMCCSGEPPTNDSWRATSDRSGRVFFPHYRAWQADQDFRIGDWLVLQDPVGDPPRITLRSHAVLPNHAALAVGPGLVRWQLPPLSKIHLEFPGADTLPADHAITFELAGPRQWLGVPDRHASDHGAPVELPTETGVELRAGFHWLQSDPDRRLAFDLLAFGTAHPIVGGCALLRVPVASDAVPVRLRPVRADGATFASAGTAGAKLRKYDVSFQWVDREGFRFVRNVRGVAPDETGSLRFVWQRPRLDAAERPVKLRVALRKETDFDGWEPLEREDLAAREVDWPELAALDVGTLLVPWSD